MRIAYLTQTIDRKSGGGRFAADIIDGVKAQGHEVVILKVIDDGHEGLVVLKRGLSTLIHISKLRKLVKDCDVIHAIDGYPFGIIAWFINKTLYKKLIISALGTYAVAPLYSWKTSFLLKKAYQGANKVIAISNLTKSKILEKVNLNNIVVINPGIEVNNFKKTELPRERFILGVGALKERKGYHISLSAFAKISKEFLDLRYVIVADPDRAYRIILDDFVTKNGLDGRVDFLNSIDNDYLEKLYATASVFVLTSINTTDHHFEGFGIVYLEAARAGTPVIGTFGTGGEDAINNGKNGILVAQNDAEETAEAMRRILSNKELTHSMVSEGIKWASQNTIENEVNRIIDIYNK